nr:type II toxin-antitoxin system prevent-host-death family antitoxin [Oceanococcus sp. HetDA_MAG_MS8]
MNTRTVTLAEAKARLSEVAERAAAGEEWVITKRGRPVGRLLPVASSKRRIDVARLRTLTSSMRAAPTHTAEVVVDVREGARY